MRNGRCHACDTRTHGRRVESSAVFCLSRIRKNVSHQDDKLAFLTVLVDSFASSVSSRVLLSSPKGPGIVRIIWFSLLCHHVKGTHLYKCWRLCDRQGFNFILFWSKREIGGGFKTSTFITPNVHNINTYVRS